MFALEFSPGARRLVLLLLLGLVARARAAGVALGASTIVSTPVLDYGYGVEAADLDNNGWPDLAMSGRDSDSVTWYNNSGGAFDVETVLTQQAEGSYAVHAVDLDRDGDLDLVAAAKFNDSVQWYENYGDGSISGPHFLLDASMGPADVDSGDLNGDGHIDIVYVADDGDEVAYFPGDGAMGFGASTLIGDDPNGPEFLDVEDMDGDGDLDVVVTAASGDTLHVYINSDGEGDFVLAHTASSLDGASGVKCGDTDGDGDLDVVVACRITDAIYHFANNGDGTLADGVELPQVADSYPQGVDLTDLDQDGDLDVLAVHQLDHKAAWYENDGAGNFGAEQVLVESFSLNQLPLTVATADVDHDGDQDVVVGARAGLYWFEIQTVPLLQPDGAGDAPTAIAGDAEVAVSWGAADDNGDQVTIYVVSDGATTQNVTGTPPATSMTFTGLTNGVAKSFRVRAVNARGASAWSAEAPAVTPAAPPDAPTAVVLTAGDGFVFVSWTAPADDGGSPVTLYEVSTAGVAVNTTLTNATVSGLTNDVAYSFEVKAYNAHGSSAAAASGASATPRFPPDAPVNVVAVAADSSAVVTWGAPADNGVEITAYTVGDGAVTVDGSATSATVPDLVNGNAYNFTVVATSAMGDSPASNASNSVIPAALPDAPTTVAVVAGDAEITVSWDAAADNGAEITEYVVAVGTATVTTAGTTSVTVTGLTNSRVTNATVESVNYIGGSGPSALSNNVIVGSPAAPTLLDVVPGNASATVYWAAGGAANGDAITLFTVVSSGSHVATVGGNHLNATVPGLANGDAYTFEVFATNARGGGLSTTTTAAVTAGAPQFPLDVAATPGNTLAVVSWTAPDDSGAAITAYTVTDSVSGAQQQTASATTSLTFTGLDNLVAVTFTVAAHNSRGTGPSSAASSSITPFDPALKPGEPSNVVGTPGRTVVYLVWDAPADDGGAAITQYSVLSDEGETQTSSHANLTFTGLTPWASRTFTVFATNYVGTGNASLASAGVTPTTAVFEAPATQLVASGLAAEDAFESLVTGDVNGDGSEDVLVMPTWYENPDWTAHVVDTTADKGRLVDVDADGDLDLIVVSEEAATVGWFINSGSGDFGVEQSIATDVTGVEDVVAVDLDQDGDLDVVVAADVVTWYDNTNGAGVFSVAPSTAGTLASGVVAFDADGDGDQDLATFSPVVVYLNSDGAGTFALSETVDATAVNISSMVAVDLDADGDLDLVATLPFEDRVVWYANAGDGSFGDAAVLTAALSAPEAVAAADLDADGTVDDVALASADSISWVDDASVLRSVSGVDAATAVAAADMDGDGDADLVVADAAAGTVSWWRSVELPDTPTDVEGVFGARQVAVSWTAPNDNGGEILEYVVTESVSGTNQSSATTSLVFTGLTPWVHVRFTVTARNSVGFSAGGASEPSDYFVPTTAVFDNATRVALASMESVASVVAADVDGDGDLDVALAAAHTLGWFNNTDGAGTLGPLVNSSTAGGTSVAVVSGQLFSAVSSAATSVSMSAGSNAVVGASTVAAFGGAVAFAAPTNGSVGWFSTAGGAPGALWAAPGASFVLAADVDSDGVADLVYASPSANAVGWFSGSGGSGGLLTTSAPSYVVALDADADGDVDLAVASSTGNSLRWFENNGTQGFTTEHVVSTAVTGAEWLAASDADGDGDTDLILSAPGLDAVLWFENVDGVGGFAQATVAGRSGVTALAVADVNGDGHDDVVLGSSRGGVEWLRSVGVPDAPTAILAVTGVNEVNMTWTAPYDNGRLITRYLVWESVTGSNATVSGSPPTPALRFVGLTAGVAYSFTVAAQNKLGQGVISAATASLTVQAVPKEYVTLDHTYFQDTSVNRQRWPDLNLNSEWFNLITGSHGNPDGHSEVWMKVDLSPLEGRVENITLAELWMFGGSIGHSESFDVFAAAGDWNETGLTWDSRPSGDLDGYVLTSVHESLSWQALDVTETLKTQYNATAPEPELNLVLRPTEDTLWQAHWASRESLDAPYLRLTYN